ncbi:MAG TPA: IPT/TIG domain-containing protein [Candidatus Acidoferrales bacterium]|jgi:hypothetical protein|nr:IPT/TIG domain-containing protein [Candidatus Acidoferrales bacterium]
MAPFSAVRPVDGTVPANSSDKTETSSRGKVRSRKWIFVAGIVFFSSLAVAQNSPQVTGVDPALGKVNDTVTVSGSNVGKDAVSAVYLSDDKNDYKGTIVDQSSDKITMKVPQVKAGSYNISLQVGDKLFIKPVKFKVQE